MSRRVAVAVMAAVAGTLVRVRGWWRSGWARIAPAVIIAADDDRDTLGPGRAAPAAEAARERRDETRAETWILIRAAILLVLIALALTARALYVH